MRSRQVRAHACCTQVRSRAKPAGTGSGTGGMCVCMRMERGLSRATTTLYSTCSECRTTHAMHGVRGPNERVSSYRHTGEDMGELGLHGHGMWR